MPDYADPWYTAVKATYWGDETRTWKGERVREGCRGRATEVPYLSEDSDCWAFWPDGYSAFTVVSRDDLEILP